VQAPSSCSWGACVSCCWWRVRRRTGLARRRCMRTACACCRAATNRCGVWGGFRGPPAPQSADSCSTPHWCPQALRVTPRLPHALSHTITGVGADGC
jgi:hypothetical protein